jgi:hypothetical protein
VFVLATLQAQQRLKERQQRKAAAEAAARAEEVALAKDRAAPVQGSYWYKEKDGVSLLLRVKGKVAGDGYGLVQL